MHTFPIPLGHLHQYHQLHKVSFESDALIKDQEPLWISLRLLLFTLTFPFPSSWAIAMYHSLFWAFWGRESQSWGLRAVESHHLTCVSYVWRVYLGKHWAPCSMILYHTLSPGILWYRPFKSETWKQAKGNLTVNKILWAFSKVSSPLVSWSVFTQDVFDLSLTPICNPADSWTVGVKGVDPLPPSSQTCVSNFWLPQNLQLIACRCLEAEQMP